ncbi:ABC-F family ATP-binding cassette domain-containing protein [Rickettsiales endosymbiont of Stachyamoeba lipophora]|uniref:ABC-F family ATP-binding cassette domain-containing protein n=1 Tax=Rickettsiales endosymbiont of Stachyamoeba lipophora TaxID=2486578 RepID=UPI000F6500C3|nr:ABC-F family ATP-binding cassette domain-containing protein [Rickettsiales endosymbiont of Stachyamoeba lipophora]AZL15284.1 ABC transporter ATP-binding protein [Rickettsiales endosymbiont of Stachyamoeba lipophora]
MLPLLSLNKLSLQLEERSLFKDLELHVFLGDKIALVGKNGSGKSSLLKTIAGKMDADSGSVFIKPGSSVKYLIQDVFINYDPQQTIYEYILNDNEDQKYLLDQFLVPLGLEGNRKLEKLSGGRLRRVELAKTIYNRPDILLLDEPTNHLDIQGIEWLENFLKGYPGAVIVISHDRNFLEAITNKILIIDRGKCHFYNEGFKSYENIIDQIIAQENESLRTTKRKLEQEEHWLTYGVTARRKRNQRRLKELKDLREEFKQEVGRGNKANVNIDLPGHQLKKYSQEVIKLENVTCGYQDVTPPKIICNQFSLRILKGEKVGLIGRNGAGKTTVIKTILGEIEPLSGNLTYAPNLKISYVDQKRESINLDKTIWDNIADIYGEYIDLNNQRLHLSSYLGQFAFSSDQFFTKVKLLSGGEQNRLLLAIALAKPCDLLVLDEPTNDLDLETLEILEDFLGNFAGTVLIVSHDRAFIDNVVTKIVIISDNKVEQFVGGYNDYLKTISLQQKQQVFMKNMASKEKVEKNIAKTKTKLSYNEQRDLEKLPQEIERLEQSLMEIEKAMSDPLLYEKSPAKLEELSKKMIELKAEIEQKESRWLAVTELNEQIEHS